MKKIDVRVKTAVVTLGIAEGNVNVYKHGAIVTKNSS
jgi:hypothetical protein